MAPFSPCQSRGILYPSTPRALQQRTSPAVGPCCSTPTPPQLPLWRRWLAPPPLYCSDHPSETVLRPALPVSVISVLPVWNHHSVTVSLCNPRALAPRRHLATRCHHSVASIDLGDDARVEGDQMTTRRRPQRQQQRAKDAPLLRVTLSVAPFFFGGGQPSPRCVLIPHLIPHPGLIPLILLVSTLQLPHLCIPSHPQHFFPSPIGIAIRPRCYPTAAMFRGNPGTTGSHSTNQLVTPPLRCSTHHNEPHMESLMSMSPCRSMDCCVLLWYLSAANGPPLGVSVLATRPAFICAPSCCTTTSFPVASPRARGLITPFHRLSGADPREPLAPPPV